MKTKEFIRKMDDVAGAAIALPGTGIHTYNFEGKKVGWVSIDEFGVADTSYPALDTMKNKEEVVKLMFEYALTPLDEREDAKKYFVKMMPKGDNYLNQSKANNHLFLSSASNTEMYKTEFTEEEYNDLWERYDKWLPKFDKDDPHFVEVQDDTTKKGEPMTKLHDSELMYPDEEFTRTY